MALRALVLKSLYVHFTRGFEPCSSPSSLIVPRQANSIRAAQWGLTHLLTKESRSLVFTKTGQTAEESELG